jgi:hypothetical protein
MHAMLGVAALAPSVHSLDLSDNAGLYGQFEAA